MQNYSAHACLCMCKYSVFNKVTCFVYAFCPFADKSNDLASLSQITTSMLTNWMCLHSCMHIHDSYTHLCMHCIHACMCKQLYSNDRNILECKISACACKKNVSLALMSTMLSFSVLYAYFQTVLITSEA